MPPASWLLSVVLGAGASAAPSLPACFDGSKGSCAQAVQALPRAAVPGVLGKPAGPSEDLVRAREVWGNQAQLKRLREANPSAKESFSFAVLGDVEPGRFPWQRLFAPRGAFRKQLKSIQGKSPDLIVQLGDFVSQGTQTNYRAYLKVLEADVRVPYISVIGNHDRSRPNGDADKTLYRTVFGDGDFSFDHGGWRFAALDTADRGLTPEQIAWLEAALDPAVPSLVFTHVPPVYLHPYLRSPDPDKGTDPAGYFRKGSDEFRRIVSSRGVRRVYMGHIHAFATAELDGVRYVVTAGGGSPLYPLPPGYPTRKKAHFVWVEAGPGTLRETVFELDGTRFELPDGPPAPADLAGPPDPTL